MRESYITCPKCGGLAGYNSYFEAYICTYRKCNYIQSYKLILIDFIRNSSKGIRIPAGML